MNASPGPLFETEGLECDDISVHGRIAEDAIPDQYRKEEEKKDEYFHMLCSRDGVSYRDRFRLEVLDRAVAVFMHASFAILPLMIRGIPAVGYAGCTDSVAEFTGLWKCGVFDDSQVLIRNRSLSMTDASAVTP